MAQVSSARVSVRMELQKGPSKNILGSSTDGKLRSAFFCRKQLAVVDVYFEELVTVEYNEVQEYDVRKKIRCDSFRHFLPDLLFYR